MLLKLCGPYTAIKRYFNARKAACGYLGMVCAVVCSQWFANCGSMHDSSCSWLIIPSRLDNRGKLDTTRDVLYESPAKLQSALDSYQGSVYDSAIVGVYEKTGTFCDN
jgi:hypothetical protein